MFIRALALIALASGLDPALSACSCVATGVQHDLSVSAVVFRGRVTEVRQLPFRPEMRGRERYTATFSVSEYWKGSPGRSLVLHLVEPKPDCIGARFELGTEYVVFAVAQQAKDYRLGDDFWYGWLDILPKDTDILTVNNFCDSTTKAESAEKVLKELGKAKRIP